MILKEYKLSSPQKRIFIPSEIESKSNGTSYNLPFLLEISGDISIAELEDHINFLIQRHEQLRTKFIIKNNELVQSIDNNISIKIEEKKYDYESFDELAYKYTKPFNLHHSSLIRIYSIAKSDGSKYLFFDTHHIIMDGISINIFISELIQLIDGNQLKAKDKDYKEFLEWEKANYISIKDRSKKYWLGKLSKENHKVEFPNYKINTEQKETKGRRIYQTLSNTNSEYILEFCKKNSITSYVFFLALYFILLYKRTNQSDIQIGTPISGRNMPGANDIIGMFVNTVVIRSEISNSDKILEFIKKISKTVFSALLHQDYPFEQIVKDMDLDRSGISTPLFNTMLAYQISNEQYSLERGIEIKKHSFGRNTSPFDLTCLIEEHDSFVIGLEYSTNIFNDDTAENYMSDYVELIEAVISNDDSTILDLVRLSDSEHNTLINLFNNCEEVNKPLISTLNRIKSAINSFPSNIAVTQGNFSLTYKELGELSDNLSNYISKLNLPRNSIVGINIERNYKLIVSALAIWKSGHAYLALNPDLPKERKKTMISLSNVSHVIYSEKTESEYQLSIEGLNQINYEDYSKKSKTTNTNIVQEVENDLIYVIFTSGSTGTPKGVLVERDGFSNLVEFYNKLFKNDTTSKITQVSSQSFDAFGFEVWSALAYGSNLHLVDDYKKMDINYLKKYINENGITHSFVTTVIAENLIKDRWDSGELKFLITAGEKLHTYPKNDLKFKLFNLYGPTEDTVWTTWKQVQNGGELTSTPTIGRPIDNHKVFIIDKTQRLVPIGVCGEICIGGIGLARGYLGDNQLTDEKFIENPFLKGERLYKTGDIGRWLINGEIEIIGRTDHQVKIRGHRIEINEIINRSLSYNKISESKVLVIESPDKSIVLFCKVKKGYKKEKLLNILAEYLPVYMIPNKIIEIKEFLYTRNGKIDNDYLERLALEKHELTEVKLPKTKLEYAIQKNWSEVLKIPKDGISVNVSFFRIGGHSLLAVMLANLIQDTLDAEVSIRDIFNNPTIEQQAKLISSTNCKIPKYELVRSKDLGLWPLTKSQKMQYFLYKTDTASMEYNIPLAFKLNKSINRSLLEKAIHILMKKHFSLRIKFVETENGVYQVEDRNYIPDIRNIVIDDKSCNINLLDYLFPFNLNKGALYQVTQIKTLDTILLLFDFHHIIVDGYSISTFLRELSDILRGKEVYKNEYDFNDYIYWTHKNNIFYNENMAEFWKTKLENISLPVDYPLNILVDDSKEGCIEKIVLDKETTHKVKQLLSTLESTNFILFLSIFNILLYKIIPSSNKFAVASPVSGRPISELNSIIGMFVNTVIHVNDIHGDLSIIDFLNRVKENTLEVFENQNVPLEVILDSLERGNEVSNNINTMFSTFDIREIDLKIDGIIIERFPIENNTYKFDISLFVNDYGDSLEFLIEYSNEKFNSDYIKKLLYYFTKILNVILEKPETCIRNIILDSKNLMYSEDKIDYSLNCNSVIDLYNSQLSYNTDKTAICKINIDGTKESITYKELELRSNNIAKFLVSKKIPYETKIGLYSSEDISTIVAMLGVLKCNCAYVPIDPNLSIDRKQLLLNQAGIEILLISNNLYNKYHDEIDQFIGIHFYLVEDYLFSNFDGIVLPKVGYDNLAYIMFTSGSTGIPKGVMIEHRNIVRLVSNQDYINFCDSNKILMTGALSFDASTFEIWGSLLHGSELFLIEKSELLNCVFLKKYILQENINVLWLSSSLFNQLFIEDQSIFEGLEFLLVGGDILNAKYIRKLREQYPELNIINGYGPTENTTFSSTFKIGSDVDSNIPIGKSLNSSKMYVIDSDENIAPIGSLGEIVVGGDGLARGYLNNPELTNEKFRSLKFSKGERFYLTGDMGRLLEDGNIEFHGRKDNQVKIRGYRIELGEIEQIVLDIDGISNASATVLNEDNGQKKIVVYYIKNVSLCRDEIIQQLNEKCSSYLLPNYLIEVDSFPLNTNGKINFKKLPNPSEEYLLVKSEEFLNPRNFLEDEIRNIWSKVLNIDCTKISILMKFSELGGHSLKMMNLLTRINSRFNSNLNLGQLYQFSSIKEQAELISCNMMVNNQNSFTIFNESEKNIVLCFPDILGQGHIFSNLARYLTSYQFIAFDFLQDLKEDVIGHYVSLVKNYFKNKCIYILGYSAGGNLAFEVTKRLEERGFKVEKLIILDSYFKIKSHNCESKEYSEIKKYIQDSFPYLSNEVIFRESLTKSYLDFWISIKNSGVVNCPLNVLKSQDSTHNKNFEKLWSDRSLSKVIIKEIKGNHYEVLNDSFVDDNALVIQDVLN